ncbi:MAG: NAD(+)/NADH kinase [Euryarchaeota archaeon]|nr:NAD(+)/NADH kinase [Euryarchaeota archaeon]
MVLRLGFIVNPVAGIGGPAAFKGSDERALEAADLGYLPSAPEKAGRFLRHLKELHRPMSIRIFAAPGVLGADETRAAGWKVGTLGADMGLHDPFATDAEHTRQAAESAIGAEMDLLVFVGGDGTARDVAATVGDAVPILGVPAGVKMFSECFTETPEEAALLVAGLARGFQEGDRLETAPAEVLDLDEEAYRAGRVEVRHHASAAIPRSPRIQSAKCPTCPQDGLEEAVGEVRLRMEEAPEGLYLIASGSTTAALKSVLGIDGTLIGVDAVTGTREGDKVRWQAVATDADATALERLVADWKAKDAPAALIVSPIGGQGFVVGRGTGQITPNVLRAVLPDRLWPIATIGKLGTLEDGILHVDTGDPRLDRAFPDHLRVVVGLGRERMMRVRKSSPLPRTA